jgi:hypothetical protein
MVNLPNISNFSSAVRRTSGVINFYGSPAWEKSMNSMDLISQLNKSLLKHSGETEPIDVAS